MAESNTLSKIKQLRTIKILIEALMWVTAAAFTFAALSPLLIGQTGSGLTFTIPFISATILGPSLYMGRQNILERIKVVTDQKQLEPEEPKQDTLPKLPTKTTATPDTETRIPRFDPFIELPKPDQRDNQLDPAKQSRHVGPKPNRFRPRR